MTERGPFAFVRENIEAFAVAIAMALVLRHFCIEAFRIPSNSMRPTLCGEHLSPEGFKRQGDRILVDKFAYLRRDARRYEVAVFLYPLNVNRNFIKRIAGMPGEWLRIVDGDLWTSRDEGRTWAIARKPEDLEDALFLPYFPEPADRPGAFRAIPNGGWEPGEGWKPKGAIDRYAVDAGEAESELVFGPRVLPYDEVDTTRAESPPYVGDVRVSFTLETERGGDLEVRIVEHGVTHRLHLGAKSWFECGSPDEGETASTTRREDLPFRLEGSGEHEISFANVDDSLRVSIDGARAEILFGPAPEAGPVVPEERIRPDGAEWWRHEIAIAARGLRAIVSDLRIDRDLHYVNGDPSRIWKVPDDCYFMLGDNTQNSNDSRGWRITEVELKGGRVIRFRAGDDEGTRNPWGDRPSVATDSEIVVEEDTDGILHRFRNSEVVRWQTNLEWPFVPRKNLVGRAFSVFWPIYTPGVYAGPTRVRVIR